MNISARSRAAYACFTLTIDNPAGTCCVSGCTRSARGTVCSKHQTEAWRRNHPEHAAWSTLRMNARRRRKPFTITLPEWKQLCLLTLYHERTAGKTGDVASSLTIDRKDPKKGYSLDNIRVITHSANASKGAWAERVGAVAVEFVQPLPPEETEEGIINRI